MKVMFVCLGNICRSPMAECIMADLAKKRGLVIEVASAAISDEEEGNGIYPPAVAKLRQEGVPVRPHTARRLTRADYADYDMFICMEQRQIAAMARIFGGDPDGKLFALLDFTSRPRDIADPWWTRDFDAAYRDIKLGCEALIDRLSKSRR